MKQARPWKYPSGFTRWLMSRLKEGVGPGDSTAAFLIHDLAYDAQYDKGWPHKSDRFIDFWSHLRDSNACDAALESFVIAWRKYKGDEFLASLASEEMPGSTWADLEYLYPGDTPYVLLERRGFNPKTLDYTQPEWLKPWHIEPLTRYKGEPPHEQWKLIDVYETLTECVKAFEERVRWWVSQRKGNPQAQSLTPKGRYQILQRDGYRCQICGRDASDDVKLEVDHKIARANGGGNDPDNLWTLCFDCNRGKGTDDL